VIVVPFTSIDIIVALSLLICGFLGFARGLIRQLASVICCVAAFICGALLASPLAKAMGASSASLGYVGYIISILLLVVLLIVSARIVHATLQSRIAMTDRALGFLFGLLRGFGVVAMPLMFFIWLMPGDKLPDQVRNSLSFPLLNNIIDMIQSLQLSDLHWRFGPTSAVLWLAIGAAAIPSTLADLLAVATRRWRLRRLDRRYGKKASVQSAQVHTA
jgi:membrane protein required for colicin V production